MPDSMGLRLNLAAKDAGVLVDQTCDPLTGEGEKPSDDFSCEERLGASWGLLKDPARLRGVRLLDL